MMLYLALPEVEIRLTDAGIGDFNTDFGWMGRCNMNILKAKGLIGFVGNSSCSDHLRPQSQECTQSVLLA